MGLSWSDVAITAIIAATVLCLTRLALEQEIRLKTLETAERELHLCK